MPGNANTLILVKYVRRSAQASLGNFIRKKIYENINNLSSRYYFRTQSTLKFVSSKEMTVIKLLGVSACFAMASVTAKAEENISEKEPTPTSNQVAPPEAIAQNSEQPQPHVLASNADFYGGIAIDQNDLPSSPAEFQQRLEASLALWTAQGKRGIWLTIPVEKVDLVPAAVKLG